MPLHPTMREIAKTLGVSATTVSLALRNSPRLPLETRRRIRQRADDMGYRQEPQVRAWLESRRQPGEMRGESLAYLNPFPDRSIWEAKPSIWRFYEGAKARAQKLGFGWDDLWFRKEGLTQSRLNGILRARGIRGVIVGSFPEPRARLRLEWPDYAAIAQGLTLIRPKLPHACNNYYETMAALLHQLSKLGYRKTGLFMAWNSSERCRRIWLASYLVFRSEPVARQIPPCLPERPDRRRFETWFMQHRPDVIVTCDLHVREWLAELKISVPSDVSYVSFDCHDTPEWRDVSGMDHQIEVCGAATVDLVAGRLSRNETGLSITPEVIMTPAIWRRGETTRDIKAHGGRKARSLRALASARRCEEKARSG